MLNKKLINITILLIILLSVSTVSAADNIVNATQTTDEVSIIEDNQEILQEDDNVNMNTTFENFLNFLV